METRVLRNNNIANTTIYEAHSSDCVGSRPYMSRLIWPNNFIRRMEEWLLLLLNEQTKINIICVLALAQLPIRTTVCENRNEEEKCRNMEKCDTSGNNQIVMTISFEVWMSYTTWLSEYIWPGAIRSLCRVRHKTQQNVSIFRFAISSKWNVAVAFEFCYIYEQWPVPIRVQSRSASVINKFAHTAISLTRFTLPFQFIFFRHFFVNCAI